MRYIPKHFTANELLPPDLFQQFGEDGLYLLDDRILWTLDQVRDFFGFAVTVNNWKSGGTFSQRGYRNDINTGAKFSAHRFGRAVDYDIAGVTADEFRSEVKLGRLDSILIYVTRIEDGVNWNHNDCMGLPRHNGDTIEFFHQ